MTNDQYADTSLSVAIVEAVAAREGIDPTEIAEPLYAVVNPDALDALFAPRDDGTPRRGGQLHFRYGGYDVTVHSSGEIYLAASSQDNSG